MLRHPPPDKAYVDDLTKEFLLESQEGLDRMEQCLTRLEERPDDAELMGEIFRAVHTIKGTTGFLGFHRLESLSHAGENLLAQVRDGRVQATGEVITALLQLMDGLRSILQLIGTTGDEGKRASDDDLDLISRIRSHQVEVSKEQGHPVFSEDWLRRTWLEDSAADGRTDSTDGRTDSTGGVFSGTPGSELAPLPMPLPMSVPSPKSVLPPVSVLPPASPSSMRQAVAASRPSSTIHGSGSVSAALPGYMPSQEIAAASESTLRVDVELLDRMMNLVGELVLTRNSILQTTSGNKNFAVLGRRLDIVTAELRESVMKARMQPVGYVFQKFPRMVRDLARTCGKQVRLELIGQDTELDKSLLEAVRDPITHAVRNSVDHGIEAPEARLLAGKPCEGKLRLRAFQEGGHVIIEVSDDGAGISAEKILAVALERNLVTPEIAAAMTAREALQLIFVPGFSTAKEVTSISGRGVGMDVVRTNVEKIGGKVELDSEPGLGTRLRMRIPLTLAIIPALIVRACGHSFAIPQSALFELVYVSGTEAAEKVDWVDRAPVYRLRDRLLPLVWLDQLVGLASDGTHSPANGAGPQAESGKPFYLTVLEADGRRFGLVVDELLDPEEIVVKPLSAVLRQEKLFSGATILGNGTLALILDPSAAGLRAGVLLEKSSAGIEIASSNAIPSPEAEASDPSFLLFTYGGGDGRSAIQAALPLHTVERIETVPYGRIEYAAGNAVLQFRGGTLLLWDTSGLLPELARSGSQEAAVSILVCKHRSPGSLFGEERVLGLVVREVLDVLRGRLLSPVESLADPVLESETGTGGVHPGDLPRAVLANAKGQSGRGSSENLVLLNGHVTSLFDLGLFASVSPDNSWTFAEHIFADRSNPAKQLEVA